MTDNLALWNSVEKTPIEQTKAITGKSYQGTSPKPHYLVHKATETFGPCGIGWGFRILDERIEEGANGDKMSLAHVLVWYKWNGETGEVGHIGGTQFSGQRKNGTYFTDEDAPKKSVTDALIKALSMIGFAGDIFMGRYDDSKYTQDLRDEAKADAAKPDEKKASSAEQKRGLEDISKDLLDCHSILEVDKCGKVWGAIAKRDGWANDYKTLAGEKFQKRRDEITKAEQFKQAVDDTFPGDREAA